MSEKKGSSSLQTYQPTAREVSEVKSAFAAFSFSRTSLIWYYKSI